MVLHRSGRTQLFVLRPIVPIIEFGEHPPALRCQDPRFSDADSLQAENTRATHEILAHTLPMELKTELSHRPKKFPLVFHAPMARRPGQSGHPGSPPVVLLEGESAERYPLSDENQ